MQRNTGGWQAVLLFVSLTLMLLIVLVTHPPLPAPAPQAVGTGIPARTMVRRHFVPAIEDASPELLQQAADVLYQRLYALGAQRIAAGRFLEDRVIAEELVTADLEINTAAVRQQGVIELVDFDAVFDPQRYIGQMIPTTALETAQTQGQLIVAVSHAGGAAAFDPFTTLLIGYLFEDVQLANGVLQFTLNNRAAELLAAQNAAEHRIALTLDGLVLDVITLEQGRCGSLLHLDGSLARQVSAIMKSGPLPMPLHHILNDYSEVQ